jgi:hypothetical protein
MRGNAASWLVCVLLILAPVLIYGQAVGFDFINLDDDLYVTANRHVVGGLTRDNLRWAWTTWHAGYWQPLTWLSLQVDAQLFHGRAAGFHAVNLLFHTVNGLLLFGLLMRMTGAHWPCAATAMLFAVHPLHVESVAWVTERKDVLSTLFWLATLWAYVRYAERPGMKRYLIVMLLLALGLLVKPMLVTLPCVLVLLDYWPLRRFPGQEPSELMIAGDARLALPPVTWPRLVWEKVPLVTLALAASALTVAAQSQVGAVLSLAQASPVLRLENALVSYVRYLGKTFWPHSLAVFYPYPRHGWQHWQAIAAGLLLLAITMGVWGFARRRPWQLVGWLWFVGTLVPVIGLVQAGRQSMADRFVYVPHIGLFIFVVWDFTDLVTRWQWSKAAVAVTAGLVVTALGRVAWIQTGYWRNSETLWRHTLAVTESNYEAHNNLGEALGNAGRIDDAAKEFEATLDINADFALAHNNLAMILKQRGQLPAATAHFRQAVQLNPNNADTQNHLGVVLAMQGQVAEAVDHFEAALRLDPENEAARQNLQRARLLLARTPGVK